MLEAFTVSSIHDFGGMTVGLDCLANLILVNGKVDSRFTLSMRTCNGIWNDGSRW